MNANTNKDTAIKDFVSNTAITAEVKARLLSAEGISSLGISVASNNGLVHLTGHVKTPEQVTEVETIARKVAGVTSVRNDLFIKA